MKTKTAIEWELPQSALDRFNPSIKAAKDDSEDESAYSLNIYGTIGDYGDGQGTTPRLVSAILRKADGAPVNININSPGGDFFDGVAIHTLLSQYEGTVNVNILGMAASAASLVALAGDNINIAKAGFLMIHNSWSLAIGNKHTMEEVARALAQFDEAAISIYEQATGMPRAKLSRMMDDETWIGGDDAISQGFAHALIADEKIDVAANAKKGYKSNLREIDSALAKAGMHRAKRRELIESLTNGTPSAADSTPSAGNKLSEELANLRKTLSN